MNANPQRHGKPCTLSDIQADISFAVKIKEYATGYIETGMELEQVKRTSEHLTKENERLTGEIVRLTSEIEALKKTITTGS